MQNIISCTIISSFCIIYYSDDLTVDLAMITFEARVIIGVNDFGCEFAHHCTNYAKTEICCHFHLQQINGMIKLFDILHKHTIQLFSL